MKPEGPVIALGLDAMEGSLVDRMLERGRLPNLAELRERGAYAEVRSEPPGFLSMVWPTLSTGQTLGAHGCYFNKLWNPSEQRLRYLDPTWLPNRPFWDDLGAAFRVAVMDVPFSSTPGPGFQGLFVNGWQAHDDFGKLSVPRGLHRDLRRRFGAPVMRAELFGPQDVRTLKRQLREGVESLEQYGQIVAEVVASESWDLALAVFGGAHRATHYLWTLDEADLSGAESEDLDRLKGAREQIYEAADRAVGVVLKAAPIDARIIVFALHGMERNRGWAEHFQAMVSHVHGRGRDPAPSEGLMYRLKKALPWRWVRQVTTRLPSSVNHAVVPVWSRRMLDWSSTRFFALPLDLNGYLRINLRGREAEGIVEPGGELEELLDELCEDFMSFRDLRNDQPIVARVRRVDDLVGADAPRRYMLPDLIVQWTDCYSHGSRGVRSRYGELRWDPDEPLSSGRSGNHTHAGWLVAAGPGVQAGRLSSPVDAVDLTATLLDWMGAPIPERMEGSPVRELVSTHVRG